MPDFGLKFFILQQRVIHLYRHALRASRRAMSCFLKVLLLITSVQPSDIPDPQARSETISWFRSEIERNRWLTDVVSRPCASYPIPLSLIAV